MGSRILVTGGAGYLGSLLTAKLLDHGHQVSVVDNFSQGATSLLPLIGHPKLVVHNADIRSNLSSLVAAHDVVFHLAALSGFPACQADPHTARSVNVDATLALVKGLSKSQRIIYSSTTSLYGKSDSICDESAKPALVSLYAQTKYEAEQIVLEHPQATALRFATIFGVSPNMRSDLLINDFVYRALAERYLVLFESQSRRTFLHCRDAVAAFLFTLDSANSLFGQIYNIGSDHLNYSKLEIATRVAEKTNCLLIDSSLADVDQRNFVTSFAKIAALGYEPKISLENGLDELIKLYTFFRPAHRRG